jgi:hypothetical protein
MSPSPLGHIYYLKMDGEGNELWIAQAGSSGGNNDIGLAVNWTDGNLYVAGITYGANGMIGSIPLLPDHGNNDGWIARVSPSDGAPVWAQRYGSLGGDAMSAIAVDADGNAYAAGYGESLYFVVGEDTLINTGSTPFAYVVQFDPTGAHTWTLGTTGNYFEKIFDVAAAPGGGCVVTGQFLSTSMGFGTLSILNTGSTTLFVGAIDPDGSTPWIAAADGSVTDQSAAICTDPAGDMLIGGWFSSVPVAFGDILLNNSDTTSVDALVAKLGSSTGIGMTASTLDPLLIFPDPAIDRIFISRSGDDARIVRIMDMVGRVVRSEQLMPNASLDVSGLARGTYGVLLLDRSGTCLSVGRLVKE